MVDEGGFAQRQSLLGPSVEPCVSGDDGVQSVELDSRVCLGLFRSCLAMEIVISVRSGCKAHLGRESSRFEST